MSSPNYLPNVKKQYEALPYPPRNPTDEKTRLISTLACPLALINHYLFNGKQNFENKFRCLVAGGGTGDAAIHLAEQLREKNGEVVHLDLSSASQNIAKERAEVRGLKNITFHQGSLLDVSQMGIGEFDFINCSGVLHHLEDPDAGLKALKSVLKVEGGMSIMVYALHGRASVYQMQELMRIVNKSTGKYEDDISNTRKILSDISKNHIIKSQNPIFNLETTKLGDSGLYDLYLHSQDRAYSVPQLYQWIENSDLKLVSFLAPQGGKNCYRVEKHITDKSLLKKVASYPIKEQQAIAEIMDGKIIQHVFYVTHQERINVTAKINDIDNIPFYNTINIDGNNLAKTMQKNPNATVKFSAGYAGDIFIQPSIIKAEICKHIDGNTSVNEIIQRSKKSLQKDGHKFSKYEIKAEIYEYFMILNHFDFILLRNKNIHQFKTDEQLQSLVSKQY